MLVCELMEGGSVHDRLKTGQLVWGEGYAPPSLSAFSLPSAHSAHCGLCWPWRFNRVNPPEALQALTRGVALKHAAIVVTEYCQSRSFEVGS